MKPRLTIRQRLVRSLSKRYKVVRVLHPAQEELKAWHTWDVLKDGEMVASGDRTSAAQSRDWRIQYDATRLMDHMRALQRHGFKVTFPS